MIKIIAGAPCSGKSTYVRERVKEGDLVYDYDTLHGALSLQPAHKHLPEIRPYVLIARDAIFRELDHQKEQTAWIITSARRQADIDTLKERFDAEVVFMNVSKEDAHKRCEEDGRPDDWHEYIESWFENGDIKSFKSKDATMKKKIYESTIELKGEGEPGEFQAVFSTFNVIDKDGDVTLPGAFEDGQKVRISYWGHRWADLPVGKGQIYSDETKAWVDGKFFLDTEAGLETYKTVKNLDDLQEWSYGFDIVESDMGKFQDEDVQYLKRLTVHEVSPVLLGAGIGTGTTSIKSEDKETTDDTQTEGEAGDGKPSGDVQPDFKLKRKRLELYKLEVTNYDD